MRACVINFGGSYHLSIRSNSFEALYGRKYKSLVLWEEIGESSLTGLDLVQETIDKVVLVKEKPKAARDRQKSYVDDRRKPLEFEVGDRVLLRVSPRKGVVHFGKKAYRLRLPEELNSVHDTFHVSNLKKCLADANLHVPLNEIKVDKSLCFVEEPVEIMEREIKKRVTYGYPWPELEGKGFGIEQDKIKEEKWLDGPSIGEPSLQPGVGVSLTQGQDLGTNRRTRVPIGLCPCHIEEKMTIKEIREESVMEWKTKLTTKDEVEENKGLKEVWEKIEYVISDSDSDLESTASVTSRQGKNVRRDEKGNHHNTLASI
ncbi:hypothetical protein Tco_0186431 [Tanacetum coccineum]